MSPEHARLRADVIRLLALIDHYEIVRHFKTDWSVLDRSADALEHQVARVRATLQQTTPNEERQTRT